MKKMIEKEHLLVKGVNMQLRLMILFMLCFTFGFCSINSDEPMTLQEIVQKEFIGKKRFDKKTLKKTWTYVRNHGAFLQYQIVDNVPYGPPSKVLSLLQVLCQKYQIPNLEFIYYNFDLMPDYLAEKSNQFAPIFVSAKKNLITIIYCLLIGIMMCMIMFTLQHGTHFMQVCKMLVVQLRGMSVFQRSYGAVRPMMVSIRQITGQAFPEAI
jgi:hypothetical protein